MRAFIALELPADFADDTAAAARRLSASLEGRFLDRSTYHLTLVFLGDIDDAEASRAMDALDVACAGSAPVSLAPRRPGKVRPPRRRDALAGRGRPTRPFRPWPNVFAKNSPPATFPSTRSLSALTSPWGAGCAFRKSPYRHWPSRCRRTPAPSHCSRARFPATAPNTSRSTQWSWGSRQRCRRQPLIS